MPKLANRVVGKKAVLKSADKHGVLKLFLLDCVPLPDVTVVDRRGEDLIQDLLLHLPAPHQQDQ